MPIPIFYTLLLYTRVLVSSYYKIFRSLSSQYKSTSESQSLFWWSYFLFCCVNEKRSKYLASLRDNINLCVSLYSEFLDLFRFALIFAWLIWLLLSLFMCMFLYVCISIMYNNTFFSHAMQLSILNYLHFRYLGFGA